MLGLKKRMRRLNKIKILLVDDDEGVCNSLSRLLAARGYDAEVRYSAQEAMKVLNKNSFDLLIADLKMPGMSGLDLLREARVIVPEMGVIILTGYGEITSYLEAMDYGADEYMNKPVKIDELELMINKFVAKKRGSAGLDSMSQGLGS